MNEQCPIESTLSLINGKWKLLILKTLSQEPVRYGAISKKIPSVSSKVLTQQLREMEEDGLIIRTVFPEIPPKVEYSLAKMGISIFTVFTEMRTWGLEEDTVHPIKCSFCKDCIPYHKEATI